MASSSSAPLPGVGFDSAYLTEAFRNRLLQLLDSIRSRKALVLESSFIQPLGLVADAVTLKEHGVDMFCTMEPDPSIASTLQEKGLNHIIYLVHSRLESLYAAKTHAAMCQRLDRSSKFHLFQIPRMMKTSEIIFEQAGLKGDTVLLEIPYPWIPLCHDVISLEHGTALKELLVHGNWSCLYEVANALFHLQSIKGSFKMLQAKGEWSCEVLRILERMRKEAGKEVPTQVDPSIDEVILLDRTVDMITPMCIQLTYEGLLDEILGLQYGQIRGKGLPGSETRRVAGLNDKDVIFCEIRDKFFGGARIWINKTLKEIQRFRDSDMGAADVSSLKGFVTELKEKFYRMPLHTNLLERLGNAMRTSSFSERQKIEASLLDEDTTAVAEIYDRIYKNDDIMHVLRLLCLYCVINEGIPKKDYDVLRKDILNTYGSRHIVTLHALQTANLLYRKEERSKSVFSAAKQSLGLLMQDGQAIDEENPEDIHYAYAGYAPMSVRLLQKGAMHQWQSLGTFMDTLPGPQKVMLQRVGDEGYAEDDITDIRLKSTLRAPPEGNILHESKRKKVLVFFIGGVTCAEISALRFLTKQNLAPVEFIVGTTKVVNGSSLISAITED